MEKICLTFHTCSTYPPFFLRKKKKTWFAWGNTWEAATFRLKSLFFRIEPWGEKNTRFLLVNYIGIFPLSGLTISLVGGWTTCLKTKSNWIISPSKSNDWNKSTMKPTPRTTQTTTWSSCAVLFAFVSPLEAKWTNKKIIWWNCLLHKPVLKQWPLRLKTTFQKADLDFQGNHHLANQWIETTWTKVKMSWRPCLWRLCQRLALSPGNWIRKAMASVPGLFWWWENFVETHN